MGYSPEMVNCFIPLMKGLGMSWSEIKATPQIELNGLLTALSEYNILHSFDGYNDKQVREMAKDNPDIMPQYNDYKVKQRRYNTRSEKKITSFREIIK
jgi:hypothetical protein